MLDSQKVLREIAEIDAAYLIGVSGRAAENMARCLSEDENEHMAAFHLAQARVSGKRLEEVGGGFYAQRFWLLHHLCEKHVARLRNLRFLRESQGKDDRFRISHGSR